MNKWQDSLINLLPVLMFMWVCDMLRPILAPEVEKKLRRKLTDGEWRYYLLESYRKGETEQYQQIARLWVQQLFDMQTIHGLVWNS
ncbi:hypothetical protein ACFLUU_00660 [Chloroflexota bacterium]